MVDARRVLTELGFEQYVLRKFDGDAPDGFTIEQITRNDIVLLELVMENNPDFVKRRHD